LKIRSQVNLLLLAAALVTAAAVGVTLFFLHDLERATQDIQDAEELINSATQLRQIGVETTLFHELRAQDQWQRKLTGIRADIEHMPTSDSSEQAKLRSISKKLDLLQSVYARLVQAPALAQRSSMGAGNPMDTSVEARTVASLLVVTQEIIDIGHALIRSNRSQGAQALGNLQLSVLLVVLTMGAFVVFVWRLVRRNILQPLWLFEEGTRQVAAGNYGHRLKLQQTNEVGALADAFDAMAEHVEQTTQEIKAHRDSLSDLVFARTTELSNAKDRAETIAQYARSLIEASLDPLVTISVQGKITDVNAASVQATGVPREALIGTDFSDYFTEPNMARIVYQQVFSEGLVRDYPLAIRHSNGAVMDVLYNAAVYRDNKGNVLGVFAAARDVTERLQLDRVLMDNTRELQSAKAVAEKASKAKSDFLSSMSHELRTPLNAILGFAQLIDTDASPPTPLQKTSLDQIVKGGWYLLELINEILDLAQIESGKIQLSLEPVSLADILRESRAMIEPQALERGIALEFAQLDSPLFVESDRTRLKQVLINLLSNAVKYNRPGGSVAVEVDSCAPDTIRISVRDTGAGLTEHQLAQLFQSFNRLGKEAGAEEGTGIGLVVTKRLVEKMAGSIGVESIVGVGSVFWVEFQRIAAPQLALHDDASSALLIPPLAEGQRQRSLLYVEDNAANLELVEQLITRRADLRFLSAPDGTIGIEFAHAHLPDVILMDINLPGISGIEAMKLLRASPATAHIPIIALSANAMQREIESARATGFFDYLTKPIQIAEFLASVNKALKLSQQQPTLADRKT
jgi:PAS domain S-box-containing protein